MQSRVPETESSRKRPNKPQFDLQEEGQDPFRLDLIRRPNCRANHRCRRHRHAWRHGPRQGPAPAPHTSGKAAAEDTTAKVTALVRTHGETVVAVLPLDDYSANPDHFVDGMTEALITDSSQSGQLRVISRISAAHYKKRELPLTQVAHELGAAYSPRGLGVAFRGPGASNRPTDRRPHRRTRLGAQLRSRGQRCTGRAGRSGGDYASEVSGLLSQAPRRSNPPPHSHMRGGKRPLIRPLCNQRSVGRYPCEP